MQTKIIAVFGGVYSSLGKGIIASSIGNILSLQGYKVTMQKMDPYLNVDPSNLSPYQHGEVFVTQDGKEADLDLGNYERFTNSNMSKFSSITSGFVYWNVLSNERKGEYDGKTIQVVPNISNAIQNHIKAVIEAQKSQFLIIEIGGTIGDIESLPFIEAINQFTMTYGRENVLSILCAPLIRISNGETKTKPIQHAWKNLNSLGVNPSMLVVRSNDALAKEEEEKLSTNCYIDRNRIFVSKDQKSIYQLPNYLYKQKIHLSILKFFGMKHKPSNDNFKNWVSLTNKIKKSSHKELKIAIVGKYVELHDAYASLNEALKFACWENNCNLSIKWIQSEHVTNGNIEKLTKNCAGIVVPDGAGVRGIEGKVVAINYARTNKIPFIGLCLGMRLALVEYARNVLNIADANCSNISKTCTKIFDQNQDCKLFLGGIECNINEKSLAYDIYKKNKISPRFRHNSFFNKDLTKSFEEKGVTFGITGGSPINNFVSMELSKDVHPFFFATLYHPDLSSKPQNTDRSLFSFIKACLKAVVNKE